MARPTAAGSTGWRTVWITGASSGIGLELARLLDGDVSHVAISARSADTLQGIAAQGRTLAAYPLDVTDPDATAQTVADIERSAGAIDLAVLGAGVWRLNEPAEFDLDAIAAGVRTNYMGVVHALAAVLPGMLARGRGHVAIVASVAGYRGLPRAVAYGPTKAALINLAETLHTELAPRGITVSIVNPGFVDTPMTRTNPFPMPGIITAEEAARRLRRGLQTGAYEIVFPRRLAYAMKLLRLLPNAAFLALARRLLPRRQDGGANG